MRVKCIAKEPKQDKNTGKWYIPNNEYDVSSARGKELIETKFFEEVKKVEVKEEKKDN